MNPREMTTKELISLSSHIEISPDKYSKEFVISVVKELKERVMFANDFIDTIREVCES